MNYVLAESPAVGRSPEPRGPVLKDLYLDKLPATCQRGPRASTSDIMAPTTEACDEYHVAAFLTIFGAALGRTVWIRDGSVQYPVLYTALVGESGISRKSTAADRALGVLQSISPELRVLKGIGSAQALHEQLATADMPAEEAKLLLKGEITKPDGTPPHRRLLTYYDELAAALIRGRSEGSTVLQDITELWACPAEYGSPTVRRRYVAQRPTLTMLACTTHEWLTRHLTSTDILGGLVNRIILVDGTPKAALHRPPVPDPAAPQHPSGVPQERVKPLPRQANQDGHVN